MLKDHYLEIGQDIQTSLSVRLEVGGGLGRPSLIQLISCSIKRTGSGK